MWYLLKYRIKSLVFAGLVFDHGPMVLRTNFAFLGFSKQSTHTHMLPALEVLHAICTLVLSVR